MGVTVTVGVTVLGTTVFVLGRRERGHPVMASAVWAL
jgi:hypothetical protein